MSTRRARRPDAQTYRQMRKRTGLGRRGASFWAAGIVVVAAIVAGYLFFR